MDSSGPSSFFQCAEESWTGSSNRRRDKACLRMDETDELGIEIAVTFAQVSDVGEDADDAVGERGEREGRGESFISARPDR